MGRVWGGGKEARRREKGNGFWNIITKGEYIRNWRLETLDKITQIIAIGIVIYWLVYYKRQNHEEFHKKEGGRKRWPLTLITKREDLVNTKQEFLINSLENRS